VAKARGSFDTALQTGRIVRGGFGFRIAWLSEALLLRGHVLQNLHHFKEAESLARELVAKRGLPFDYGLLGDALMEQGRIKEAVAAYQSMVDGRPDLQSYSRIAHIRWLTGDLEGAIEMSRAAVSASSPNDADSAAGRTAAWLGLNCRRRRGFGQARL
jgi:tetratricopeptide (TPR) repeat protein